MISTHELSRMCLKCQWGAVRFEVKMGSAEPAHEIIHAKCEPCGAKHIITLKRNSETNAGFSFDMAPEEDE
ncbi:MAG: hypothetical protein Q8L14_22015 [Myxococcales bacterium]|nr:hypothetical protein [Myxococcales bacterium]